MSGHADTARKLAHDLVEAYADEDAANCILALVAENQRLRDALEQIAEKVAHPKWPTTTTDYKMLGAISALDDIWKIVRSVKPARAALAGTPSKDTE
jgi:hypothetical protein